MPDISIELTKDELYKLIYNAFKHGYSTYEMVEVGLDSYDPDGYASWIMLKYINK